MKTKLFSTLDVKSDHDFDRDLKRLFGLTDEPLSQLPHYAEKLEVSKNDTERDNVRVLASKKTTILRSELDHALDATRFLLRAFYPNELAENDNPEDIVKDLIDLDYIKENRADIFNKFFSHLSESSKNIYYDVARRRTYSFATLPILVSVNSTVNYRVVFDTYFKVGDDVEKYVPKCEGTIPIGNIDIRLSEDAPQEHIFFQVDRYTLKSLSSHLLALEKEFETSNKYLHLDKRG